MRCVKGVLPVMLSIILVPSSPAVAGKNAGGALVVHVDDAVSWTTGICDDFGTLVPQDCESLNTRSDNDEGWSLIWFIAAFPEGERELQERHRQRYAPQNRAYFCQIGLNVLHSCRFSFSTSAFPLRPGQPGRVMEQSQGKEVSGARETI